MTTAHVGLFLRALLGTVLLAAGALKLVESQDSRERAIGAYGLLPQSTVSAVAFLLPIVEIVIGSLLFGGVFVMLTASMAAALFSVFAVATGLNLVRGRELPCACFGAGADSTASWRHVALDVVLLLSAVVLALVAGGWVDAPAGVSGSLSDLETLSVFMSGAGFVLLAATIGMALTLLDSRSRLLSRVNAAAEHPHAPPHLDGHVGSLTERGGRS